MKASALLSLAVMGITFASASNIFLPSYPLAVKTPYLSTWLPGDQSGDAPTALPQFWQGQNLTWNVLARVDGTAYTLFGVPEGVANAIAAKQSAISFTSTHTLITLQAGSANFTLDFFSPVDPVDYVRQTIPYSYLTVTASGTGSSTIDVLSAIDDSWTAQNGTSGVLQTASKGTQYFTLSGLNAIPFTEDNQMATWGDVVFASRPSSSSAGNLSCQSGSAESVLSAFVMSGALTGPNGTYASGDLVACAHTLASASGSSNASATFAVGLQQDQAIKYKQGSQNLTQTGYYQSQYKTIAEVVGHFFDDFEAAKNQSQTLDAEVVKIGQAISTNYTDLLEASVRQSFGGLQVTIPQASLDTSQAKAFIKEISTDGNVNTLADLIPKALPIFYVLAPEYIRLLLEPVLIFSYQWPLNHAIHDIGANYPNATGQTPCTEEFLALDSTTVLLWMVYGYQQATGNTTWATPYVPLLQKYADYCVDYGLYPVLQRSSVDSIGAAVNQTALAISAAIALKAFGALSNQSNYTDVGTSFAETVVDIGRDSHKSHFLAHYGDPDTSWVTAYPLTFDRLLGLNTFNTSVADAQSAWYATHEHTYGIQFASSEDYTLLEFASWAAAVSSDAVRNFYIDSIHLFLTRPTTPADCVPGPTQWNVTGGVGEGFWQKFSKAKSVIGSTFMIAAIQQQTNLTSAQPSQLKRARSMFEGVEGQAEAELSNVFREYGISGRSLSSSTYRAAEEPRSALVRRSGSSVVIDVPGAVPKDASQVVHPTFVGLSIDTESFPAYAGNTSFPTVLSRNLIQNLNTLTGANITIRVGGTSGDHRSYDANQAEAVVTAGSDLTLGPSYFQSFEVFGNNSGIQWVYLVPLAPSNLSNAIEEAKVAISAIGIKNIYALEIGNEPNLYAGIDRPSNYECQNYTVEWARYAEALMGNITAVGSGRRFEALDLSSGTIVDPWTVDDCFTAGIDAVHTVKTISSHYYQATANSSFSVAADLMNHTAVTSQFAGVAPQVNYLTDTFTCIPYVLSQVDSVSNSKSVGSSLGAALWNVDFLLYTMSKNVTQVYMQESLGQNSSAWQPAGPNNTTASVSAPYYALIFASEFVGNTSSLRVAPVLETENLTAYAGFEAGQLSKIAVVNLDEWNATTTAPSTRPRQDLQLTVPDNVTSVEVRKLTGPGASSVENVTFAGTSWTVASVGLPVVVTNDTTTVMPSNGSVSVTVAASEALFLSLTY